jgi:hypothetical protein
LLLEIELHLTNGAVPMPVGGNMLEGSLPSELGFLSIVKSIDLCKSCIRAVYFCSGFYFLLIVRVLP